MKSLAIAYAFTAIFTGSLAAPELTGILALPNTQTQFSLRDPVTKETSGWIAIGRRFEGYDLLAFDPSTEVLSLKKEGRTTEVRLATPSQPSRDKAPTKSVNEMSDEELRDIGLLRIKAGDTGGKIARVHKLTMVELKELNPEVDWTRLKVGQILRLSKQ